MHSLDVFNCSNKGISSPPAPTHTTKFLSHEKEKTKLTSYDDSDEVIASYIEPQF